MDNVIFGGDFNCIISPRDSSTGRENLVSKALKNFIHNLGLKDVALSNNVVPEYTYIRKDYASRIDRIYVKNLVHNKVFTKTIPVVFSDHNMVLAKFKVNDLSKGKGYWKLNSSLLEIDGVLQEFADLWNKLRLTKTKFGNILERWEFSKKKIKDFFSRIATRQAKEKYGLINLLQVRLRYLYELCNTGKDFYEDIKVVKNKINDLQNKICEGVIIRAKLQDQVEGEKMSSHLLGKEKTYKSNQLMTKMRGNSGAMFTDTKAILLYLRDHFKVLYNYVPGSEVEQKYLLDKCKKQLDETDNDLLEQSIDVDELWKSLKKMNNGKSPGSDGLTVEFYKKCWSIIRDDFVEMVHYVCERKNV